MISVQVVDQSDVVFIILYRESEIDYDLGIQKAAIWFGLPLFNFLIVYYVLSAYANVRDNSNLNPSASMMRRTVETEGSISPFSIREI